MNALDTPSSGQGGYCPECGKPLPAGRVDKKFCSAACKNRYHYRRSGSYRNYRLRVMNALERNHRILEDLLEQGIRSMDKMELLSRGFVPEYCSSCCRVRGHLEYACYDLRYFVSDTRIWGLERIDGFLQFR